MPLLLLAIPLRSSIQAASFLGLAGLIAGVETHFPNWNSAGFPTSYLLAGSAYLAGNWFIAGLVLGAVRRKLKAEGVADDIQPTVDGPSRSVIRGGLVGRLEMVEEPDG